MRHTLREAWSGLRRNASMSVAVIMTMWVSLTLFGAGLLVTQQVDLMKAEWYGRIEITVYLCIEDSRGGQCEEGQDATDAQRAEIEQVLTANPEVERVYYESREEAFASFQKLFANQAILASMTVDSMQDSFRIKLVNPEEYQGVVSAVTGLPGVHRVQDLREYLDPIFAWLNMIRWATVGTSAVLLLAAALQIGNTIRMAAFSRRREIGIMRLVGASNWYIMLPFLLESLVTALVGWLLATGSLAAIEYFVIQGRAASEIRSWAWIDWSNIVLTAGILALVAVVLSIIPTLLATRRFLRV
jgi:cell division transport system permease protein